MTIRYFTFWIVVISGLLFGLGGCATGSHAPGAGPLVPVRLFVADWDGNGNYQISPDGKKLLWSARKGWGQGLFVKNLETGRQTSYDFPGGIWAQDSRYVLMQLDNGTENVQVLHLDTLGEDPQVRLLTPFVRARTTIQSQIRGSNDLLLQSNRRDAKVFDVYRYTHATGALTLLAKNPGTVDRWVTNSAGALVARMRKDNEQWVFETPMADLNGPWQTVFQMEYGDTVEPLEVASDGHSLWALSNRGRDKLALVRLDLSTGVEQVFYEDARVDVSRALLHPVTSLPLAVLVEAGHPNWVFFDADLKRRAESWLGGQPGRLDFVSASQDGSIRVVTRVQSDRGQHLLIQRDAAGPRVLGETLRSRLQAYGPPPTPEPIAFQSRDGLALHGYLTRPAHTGVGPVPAVVLVHGGPWARDVAWDADPMPLFLANRGYAVLQVNFRGSSGYGRAYMEAAQGEFAGKMQTDLLDGVDSLVAQGIVDPQRVAIMGASYGGYASLMALATAPERFRCAISMVGPTDLARLVEDAPAYWELGKSRWTRFVGDPAIPADRQAMDAKSPLFHASKVQGPVLLLHGDRDSRVKVDQATRMAAALREAGKVVDFHRYAKAGHGPHRWQDRLDYYRRTEDFLASCLRGRNGGFDYLQLFPF